MSIESAKAFLTRIDEDEAFKNKILAIEDVEARLACAKAEGYEFTREEVDGLAVEGAVGAGETGGKMWKCSVVHLPILE